MPVIDDPADGRKLKRISGGRRRLTVVAVVCLLIAVAVIANPTRPSVWVENDSAQAATFFVTDSGTGPAAWYIVPAHTSAHAGSDGISSSNVRVNVLGWNHVADHVGPCAPGDYPDMIDNVPPFSSVRLLIDETGKPSVSVAPEPPGLPRLVQAPIGNLPEAQRC